jgi:hypothetical protein
MVLVAHVTIMRVHFRTSTTTELVIRDDLFMFNH